MFFVHQANKRKGRPRRETWCGPAGLSTNSFIPIDFCKKNIDSLGGQINETASRSI